MKTAHLGWILAGAALAAACTHKVEVIAPKDPIRIELAIKIDQDVRVRLEEDVKNIIDENPNLF